MLIRISPLIYLLHAVVFTCALIFEIDVGRRVVAFNPELTDLDRLAFVPEPGEVTWKQVTLRMFKPGGGVLDISLLRPPGRLAYTGAEPGGVIDLDVPEMGASGLALMRAVEACPKIERSDWSDRVVRRVVMGVFRHTSGHD